jgi:hypothetical protein
MDPKPVDLSPRSTVRGRPRTDQSRNGRDDPCARCGRNIPRLAARWPEGRLCNICYFDAIHTRGTCPECLQDRLLPGPPNADGLPICSACADIPYDFHCERCDVEAGHHRGRLCARCALRDDLHGLLGGAPSNPGWSDSSTRSVHRTGLSRSSSGSARSRSRHSSATWATERSR